MSAGRQTTGSTPAASTSAAATTFTARPATAPRNGPIGTARTRSATATSTASGPYWGLAPTIRAAVRAVAVTRPGPGRSTRHSRSSSPVVATSATRPNGSL